MDIINEIEKLMSKQTEDGGFMRAQDISEAINMSPKSTLKYLGILNKQGRLETTYIQVRSITGRVATVPAYRIKPE